MEQACVQAQQILNDKSEQVPKEQCTNQGVRSLGISKKELVDRCDVSSNIKFANKSQLACMETKIARMKVHESSIPLNILYNDTVNQMKQVERKQAKDPKALIFSIINDPKTLKKQIRFQVLGHQNHVETMPQEPQSPQSNQQGSQGDILINLGQRSTENVLEVQTQKRGYPGQQFQIQLDQDKKQSFDDSKTSQTKRNTQHQWSRRHRSSASSATKSFNKALSLYKAQILDSQTPKNNNFANAFKEQEQQQAVKNAPVTNPQNVRKTFRNSVSSTLSTLHSQARLENLMKRNNHLPENENQVINVNIQQKRIGKLNNIAKELTKQNQVQSSLNGFLSKRQIYQKWYLSPKQLSEQCKRVEQDLKPKDERDTKFQEQKKSTELMEELISQHLIKEEQEHRPSGSQSGKYKKQCSNFK